MPSPVLPSVCTRPFALYNFCAWNLFQGKTNSSTGGQFSSSFFFCAVLGIEPRALHTFEASTLPLCYISWTKFSWVAVQFSGKHLPWMINARAWFQSWRKTSFKWGKSSNGVVWSGYGGQEGGKVDLSVSLIWSSWCLLGFFVCFFLRQRTVWQRMALNSFLILLLPPRKWDHMCAPHGWLSSVTSIPFPFKP